MELEGSLLHSQVPAICPYPEPARSSPYPHIPLPEDPSKYCSPIYGWVSPVVFFPLGFPTKTLYTPLPCPIMLHAPPIQFSRFYGLCNFWWGVQVIKLLVTQSSPFPCHLVPLKPNYPPQHPQPTFLTQRERPSFTPIQKNRQTIVLYILIFEFLDSKLED